MAKLEANEIEVLNMKIDNLKRINQNYKKEVTMKEPSDKCLNISIHRVKDENQA